jgi:6-phosphofructo-2-kinase/fructose-2,6-biphosphatase 4
VFVADLGGEFRACSGVWDGLSTEEAKALYPDEWERFLSDPYAHRAPRAESYHDLSGA